MAVNFTPRTVYDGFLDLKGGVNSGWSPFLIANDELSFAWNATVRGGIITHRPAFINIPLEFRNDVIRKRVTEGNFQGGTIYTPDSGIAYAVYSVSGRLFQSALNDRESSLTTEITINAGTLTAADFLIPAVTNNVTITVVSTSNIFVNAPIEIAGVNYLVVSVNSSTSLTISNVDGTAGTNVLAGSPVTFWDVNPALRPTVWMEQAEKWLIVQDGQSVPIIWDGARSRRAVKTLGEIQAGKMMEYHRGRLAKVNPDGKTYSIGDIVYGSSGTPAAKHRDAVLYVKENTLLNGGGFFTIPGNYGEITFIRGMAQLDTSLGAGPLQIGTRKAVFSVDLPPDRTTWQSITDPIQTVSLINSGGQSQASSITVNSDLYFRSVNGVRTLIQGIREFTTTGGNTPISREMNRILPFDDPKLLKFASAVNFDNRMIMTCSPSYSKRGTFHRGFVALDFDVLTSNRKKEPAVWDGLWTGTNCLQIMEGDIDGQNRCFQFVVTGTGEIQLWELTNDQIFDKGNIPIKWAIETADFFRKGETFHELDLKRLFGGELYVEDVIGRVDFKVWFKPDQHPCWVYWHSWYVCAEQTECVTDSETGCRSTENYKPHYSPRMPFGQPPDTTNPSTNRPYRVARTFQLRIQVIGHCKIRACRLLATTVVPEPPNPEPACDNLTYDTPGQ